MRIYQQICNLDYETSPASHTEKTRLIMYRDGAKIRRNPDHRQKVTKFNYRLYSIRFGCVFRLYFVARKKEPLS